MLARKRLAEGAAALGIGLGAEALDRFEALAARLYEANRTTNLTGVPPEEFVERHALESLHPAWVLGGVAGEVIDVGCGAGFPGLPLKIAFPEARLTLLDSHAKALEFAVATAEMLGLNGVRTVHARAEEAAHEPEHRERYDLAVCRAVSGVEVAAELIAGFVRVGGAAVPHRTAADPNLSEETLEPLGFTLENTREVGGLRYPVLRKTHAAAPHVPRPWRRLRRSARATPGSSPSG